MDAFYNADTRNIAVEVILYDNANAPTVLTRDGVLIDFDLLEEASADSKNVFGAISANEISFSIYNEDNKYSPQGGRVRRGVLVKPRIKAEGADWTDLGEFYISSANTSIDGAVVHVTAFDRLETIFSTELRNPEALSDVTYESMYARTLDKLGVPHKISNKLDEVIKHGYISSEVASTLQDLTVGAMAICNVNRQGEVEVQPIYGSRTLRATLTDNDQIISIPTSISNVRSFDSASLTYYNAQLTDQEELVRVKDFDIPPGLFASNEIQFAKTPVAQLNGIGIRSNVRLTLESYSVSAHAFKIQVLNETGNKLPVDLVAYGRYVDFIPTLRASDGKEQYKVDCRFIQNEAYATRVYNLMERYANSHMPYLDIDIRGNPNLLIGDKIRVQSDRFGIDFEGIVYRAKYQYNGSLKCSMTLLDSSILEEV